MIVADLEMALAAEVSVRAGAISGLPENQWFDRKSVLIKPKDLARHLVAFANAEGGAVVLGIRDRKAEGISARQELVNAARQAPIDFTSPPVRARFTEPECVLDDGTRDRLLVIWIEPGERVHETVDGECYLRVGDESRRLSFDQRRELEYDRGQAQFDGQAAADVQIGHLDEDDVFAYGRGIGVNRDLPQVLQARSLLTRAGDVTNAAYLLFGRDPRDLLGPATE